MNKRLKEANKLVDKSKLYNLNDAISILKNSPAVKFDESVDIAIKLNTDQKEALQSIRGSVVLPHGTGKDIRVAVLCKDEHAQSAKDAGGDLVGDKDLVEKIIGGFLDFDTVIATPDMMKEMGRLGKVLGPRGLMPSPKAGTVTNDVAKAVKEAKAGKVEFKMDKLGCVNMTVGKRSFEDVAIKETANSVINAVAHARPATVKGKFILSIAISTTMGPGVKLDVA